MYNVKFCKGPKGLWIGVTEYNGGHEFATGRTLDMLVKHMKANMSVRHNVSARQVILDTKQTDAYEFGKLYNPFMSPIFKGRYWVDKNKGEFQEPKAGNGPVVVAYPKPTKKSGEYITETQGQELVVYELREVARYKLHGVSETNPNQNEKSTDPDPTVCPTIIESQEEKFEF